MFDFYDIGAAAFFTVCAIILAFSVFGAINGWSHF